MNLHDIYSLATHLPGSWLLNKYTLDKAIEYAPYGEAHRAAATALYNMIQEKLETADQMYKDNMQHILQQLTSDPEINDAIKAYSKEPEALEDYMSKVTFEKDTDGDGDIDTKIIKTTEDKDTYW